MFVLTVHTALGLPGNSDTAISLTYTPMYTEWYTDTTGADT